MQPMRKSRLSDYKQDRLIEHFVAGTTARTAYLPQTGASGVGHAADPRNKSGTGEPEVTAKS